MTTLADLAQALYTFLTTPFVTYALLIVGMWCVVLAASIPGTGFPEAGAVICLGLASVGLVQLRANLAGLILIGLAVILFILEFRLMAHGALLTAGALVMTIGSVLLFKADTFSEWLTSFIMALSVTVPSTGIFSFFVYKGLQARRLPTIQNPDQVIGTAGTARTQIDGEGAVYAGGEEWSAWADQPIPAGSAVTVVKREGLRVKVVPAKDKPSGL